MRLTARNLKETEVLAAAFIRKLARQGRGTTAVVVGLSGDLGAGKTAFVKGMGKALGIKETVTSPTFVIEKIYATRQPIFSRFIHIDAYRLENPRELEVLGFRELLEEPKNIIVIEWAEKVSALLPKNTHWITLSYINESARKIHIRHAQKHSQK